MAFDPDEYLAEKSAFNPDEYLAESAAPEAERPISKTESALAGVQNLFDFGPKVQGATDALLGSTGTLLTGGAPNPYADQSFGETYEAGKAESRADFAKKEAANPISYNAAKLAMEIPASALMGPGAAMGAGALTAAGNTDFGDPLQAATDVSQGATYGLVADKVARFIGGKLTGKGLASKAEQLAENATGATGAQAAKFQPGAGRELLDQGIVGFGDTVDDIARKSGEKVVAAESALDSSLSRLDDVGAAIPRQRIADQLDAAIAFQGQNAGAAPVTRQLSNIAKDVAATPESIPLSLGEATKKSFGAQARNWSDPNTSQAAKQAYDIYKNTVESVATEADPALAAKFTDAKKSYALFEPIQEAAQRRALASQQSPMGGLMDTVALGAGVATGNPAAVLAPVARRGIAPRLASSAAVTTDKLSRIVPKLSPKFQSLLSAGGRQAAINHFLLTAQDPQYREEYEQASALEP